MPDVKITVGETYAQFFYRLAFPDGKTLVVAAAPLSPDVAGGVIGTLTPEYTLVIPIDPRGLPWAFLRGYAAPVAYVQQQTQLPPWACSLLSALMTKLTAASPADDIADAAQRWYEGG